jgi:protease I
VVLLQQANAYSHRKDCLMQLQGKRLAILVEDLYEDLGLWYPVLRFREAGAEVTLVGSSVASV